MTLQIAKVSNRGNKFAITAGKSILAKFASIDAAKESLNSNRKTFEYWAESASVSVDNSKWVVIEI
ncbi:hypothetical protein SAMN05192545_3922 [Maribacter dokdonensis]|uniref:Uncharacterized protein n=1 Tax=Maribacter dokdonensis TaxID=320912 RepID=A0ABY0V0L4_9FLAO|nr:hypothetical protein SAMN05192545_3922 [Maribacter dokdonensis]